MLMACLTHNWVGITVGTAACHEAHSALESLQSLGASSATHPGLPSITHTFTEMPEVGLLQPFPNTDTPDASHQKD